MCGFFLNNFSPRLWPSIQPDILLQWNNWQEIFFHLISDLVGELKVIFSILFDVSILVCFLLFQIWFFVVIQQFCLKQRWESDCFAEYSYCPFLVVVKRSTFWRFLSCLGSCYFAILYTSLNIVSLTSKYKCDGNDKVQYSRSSTELKSDNVPMP